MTDNRVEIRKVEQLYAACLNDIRASWPRHRWRTVYAYMQEYSREIEDASKRLREMAVALCNLADALDPPAEPDPYDGPPSDYEDDEHGPALPY